MRFVCLCYYNHAQYAACTPADLEEVGRICAPRDAELQATGRVILQSSLGEPHTARTLRAARSGEAQVSDGPWADTADQLGAMFIIEAENLDDAVRIARIHPGSVLGRYFGGGIEVRPFDSFVLSAERPAPIGS